MNTLAIDPAQFECTQITRDWAIELAGQISEGRADMYRLLAAGVPQAISIPFFDDLRLAETTAGKGAAKPGQWLALGLPDAVANALANALNAAAERVR